MFTDVLDGSVYVIPDALESGDLNQRLAALASEAEIKVNKAFAAFKGQTEAKLQYLESGDWSTVPRMPRLTHGGLKTGTDGISTLLFADSTGFHITFEGAKKDQYFGSLEEMQKAYDKQNVFPELVNRDVGHLLVDIPYSVESVTDDEKTTTVTLNYDGGHTGVLTYKNGVLDSTRLAQSTELAQRQEMEVQKEIVKFFSRAEIQDKLVEAKGIDPDLYLRLENFATEGLVSNAPGIEYNAGLFRTASKTASEMFNALLDSNDWTGNTVEARAKEETELQMDKDLGSMIVQMNKELLELLQKGLPRTQYEQEKKMLMKGYESQIDTLIGKEHDIQLSDEELNRMKTAAEERMEEALSPMKHLLSMDGNQEALYQEKLQGWQKNVVAAITALGRNPMKSKVDAVIEQHYADASKEANEHRGLNTSESADLLIEKKLNGTNQEKWKEATRLVYSNLSNNLAWKASEILNKGENLKDLMDLYYEKIKNGNAAASKEKAKEYVLHYFLPLVHLELKEVSYQEARGKLEGLKSFDEWLANPEQYAVPSSLDESFRMEQDKDAVMESFMEEFDTHLQIGTLNPTRLDFWDQQWPEHWRASVERRAQQIRTLHDNDPVDYTSEAYRQDLVDFRKFVALEHNVFQLLIQHDLEPDDHARQIEGIIDRNFTLCWKDKDYPSYFKNLYKEIVAVDEDWLPEWQDPVIEEALDGIDIERLFTIPFLWTNGFKT
ncbi:hypothetical protein IPG41_01050 [Candidatus Peregrinibacteria bacterium]|nr:MAG: hypothetical protein IPG41_01050 [Candidatus Peregrinibacteria bacterium]